MGKIAKGGGGMWEGGGGGRAGCGGNKSTLYHRFIRGRTVSSPIYIIDKQT